MKNTSYSTLNKLPWFVGRYIILYVIIIIIIGAVAFLEYHDRTKESLILLQSQADITTNLIAFAGLQQLEHSSMIEENMLNRAFDVLSSVAKLSEESQFSENDLNAFLQTGFIISMAIYDSDGNILVQTDIRKHKNQGRFRGMGGRGIRGGGHGRNFVPPWVLDFIASSQDSLVIGLPRLPFHGPQKPAKQRFAIGLKYKDNMILVCQLSTEAKQRLDASSGLTRLLNEMVNTQGIAYIHIEDSNNKSISVGKDGVELDVLSNGFVETTGEGYVWRRTPLMDFIEIQKYLKARGNKLSLTIGFFTYQLEEAQSQIINQLLMRTIVATILMILVLSMSISKREKLLLEKEKGRIEKEVRRLENLQRVQEKQVALGELAAGVAHEIRNPLNAISIHAQRLKREFLPSKKTDDFLLATQIMIAEIKRIDQILRNFLDYARPTPLKPKIFNLAELYSEIEALFSEQAKQKNIKLEVHSKNISLFADRNYMQQALINLVKNAIEVSTPSNVVSLKASRKNGNVKIQIQDEGKGIPKNEQNRIFDLFYTTKEEGTGVGLAITHKIITDHLGTIEVNSSPETGTEFIIIIPKEMS